MKYVLAVRDLHYRLPRQLIELLQTDAAVIVFCCCGIEHIGLQQGHVGLNDFLSLDVIQVFIGILVLSVEVLGYKVAEDRKAEEGQGDGDQDRQAQQEVGFQFVREL